MRTALAALLLLTACSTTTTLPTTSPFSATAPWSEVALSRASVPAITQWEKAENRNTCALLASASLGAGGASATSRAATFSGGWAVMYDLPNLRSAFGVAGTGADPSGPTYDQWPHAHTWDDGSKVEYGPEGGSGPNQLTYLRVAGQGWLYNVWSRLVREHLEHLIRELRMVR